MKDPKTFLDPYRGTLFHGEWPTLPELFSISVSRFPEKTAFRAFEPKPLSVSFGDAQKSAWAVAETLMSHGIQKGDRVAVHGKNSPEWAIAFLGVLYAGATVVPIDVMLGVDEVEFILKHSESRVFIADVERISEKRLSSVVERCYSLEEAGESYVLDFARPAGFISPQAPSEHDLAAILYTSGTTGVAKGVMLTHANFVSDVILSRPYIPLFDWDVYYAVLPIHHSYTLTAVFLEGMSMGSTVVFGKRLNPQQLLKELNEGGVTMFLGVPLLFNKLMAGILRGIKKKGPVVSSLVIGLVDVCGFIKEKTGLNLGKGIFASIRKLAGLGSVRLCIAGGGPLTPETFRRYNGFGFDFIQGYGLTETAPILTLNPHRGYKDISVGKILPGVEMKVMETDEVGRGEIVVRGPMVMKGYYKAPEVTAEVLSDDGWFRTGDAGWIDKKGFVYLTGRKKNLIVTEGGKNVYPEEIENRFNGYLEIEQVLVRGFILDEKTRSEGIEVLIYPAADAFPAGTDTSVIHARINEIVALVDAENKTYEKIARHFILDEPMAMTTKRTVKRHVVQNMTPKV